MPRALEMLYATLRGIEQGKIDGIEAIDILLNEELSLRENRRIKAARCMVGAGGLLLGQLMRTVGPIDISDELQSLQGQTTIH